ncbi:NDP-hexose 2,3-dehydratase family protein [Streptomyces phaeoluteigriseus]|uniref:NDP-hexose 2,3-dehydratase family protein n=1 Tax=Streptomyces phaeoluteigriseus TaxID=114686 RepID=UPI0036B4B73A
MSTATVLRPRVDDRLTARFARSAAATRTGAFLPTHSFTEWLARRARAHRFRVDRIPFAELDGWSFRDDFGVLGHHSGRFFTVEGVSVTTGPDPLLHWQQPIINQPEVGILGILAKEFDGVLHFLMQAKMEPGNPNLLQLSPTVQATRSNYTKVHRGSDVKYIDHFVEPGRGRVLADVMQSEHGAWFLRKSNRNMIVETDEDVPVDEDFCWLTLGQIGELLHRDNVVNMDARTVLACAPTEPAEREALHSDTEVRSWFTAERSRHDVRVDPVPLARVTDWVRTPTTIEHVAQRYFRVVAVSVQADSREVTAWSQPLIEPCAEGVIAFVTRRFAGVPHVLVHARVEGGFLDTVELAPTVQYTPENYAHRGAGRRPPFLDLVLDADPADIRYEAIHSEEGGRFLNAESRYLFVTADADQAPDEPPPGYRWVTPGQLNSLVRHGHYLNVQARTLLAVLNCGAVRL